MRREILASMFVGAAVFANAQGIYNGSATRINDLVHTRLEVRFDYAHSYVYGKVELTLRPHFYPTDSLMLDAKQMSISAVALVEPDSGRGSGGSVDAFGRALRKGSGQVSARQLGNGSGQALGRVLARPLGFDYDGWRLRIRLPRQYRRTEQYVVRVVYIAKPAEA
ncbi:MAG TPA: hypothetical protein VKQ52_19585, partial [Puia sp.]|nr:hypothetical protein [Puia sp.]